MKSFDYFQPTEILFGEGRVNEIGDVAKRFGKRILLVTRPVGSVLKPLYDSVKTILADAGLEVAHYDQVQPNPTTGNVTSGADLAKFHKADVVIGLGGGSSMDSAKAIAVEATHKGTSWDYLFYREIQPTEKTLPIIAISTTSGTGSHVTQVAVVTNSEERCKSAIYNPVIYPKVAIVDPELMLTVPEHITASTGFDAFCHSFESLLHPQASSYTDTLATEAIKLIAENLPVVLNDLGDKKARANMAYADTLAGLCIANAGVTLPHGVGMAISGMYPHVMHGEALALVYPEFMRFTWRSAINKFAGLGRILSPEFDSEPDEIIAEKSCLILDDFLKKIGMWFNFHDFKILEDELPDLGKASMILPDYKNNPKIATLDDIMDILSKSYSRN